MIQRLVNTFDPNIAKGYYAAIKIDGIAITPMVSVGNAVSTFIAQNMGAKKFDRLAKGYHAGLWLDLSLSVLIAGLVLPFGGFFLSFFIKNDPTAMESGLIYLRTIAPFYILMGIMNTSNGVFRGAGDMKHFLAITLINLITRLIFAYSITPFAGYKGIAWSMDLSWVVSMIIAVLYYRSNNWKKAKEI
jgi:Na+-driven multidrug efflux pump